MKVVVETIGTHTATGADSSARVSKLGADGYPTGIAGKISSLTRIITVTGIAGGSTMKIQASLDNSNWFTWISESVITADDEYVITDGPLYIRSYCVAYGSGTVTVKVQKFIEE